MLDLLVTRIRLTRDIPLLDHHLVKKACRSGNDPVACNMIEAGFTFPVDDEGQIVEIHSSSRGG